MIRHYKLICSLPSKLNICSNIWHRRFSEFLSDLEIKAYSGDIDSIVLLGQKLMDGEFGENRLGEAQAWLEKAANKNHFKAQYMLGIYFDKVDKNTQKQFESSKEFIKDIKKSANSDAKNNIKKKEVTTSNFVKNKSVSDRSRSPIQKELTSTQLSAFWLYKAATNGYVDAMVYLGNKELSLNEPSSIQNALTWYDRAATSKSSSADALYNLGTLYFEGRGDALPVNYAKSKQYFQRAADLGDANAIYWIGYCSMCGEGGFEVDTCLGLERIRHAADMYSHGGALYYLAMVHRNGNDELNIVPDTTKYLDYLNRSLDSGNADAAFALADMYMHGSEEGEGVHSDITRAIETYQIASDLGSADAALCLGSIFYSGRGLAEASAEKAFEYYNVAAERGSMEAWRNLASMYYLGDGVQKSTEMAKQIINFLSSTSTK